jgi:hypothetical protein
MKSYSGTAHPAKERCQYAPVRFIQQHPLLYHNILGSAPRRVPPAASASGRCPPGMLGHSAVRTCALALDIHTCQGAGPGDAAAETAPGAGQSLRREMGGPPGVTWGARLSKRRPGNAGFQHWLWWQGMGRERQSFGLNSGKRRREKPSSTLLLPPRARYLDAHSARYGVAAQCPHRPPEP